MNIILEYWPVITVIAVLIFDWGVIFQKIKSFPSTTRVNDMIDNKLKGHCPNTVPLRTLDLKVQRLEKNLNENQHIYDIENKLIALSLQEIRINLKNICFHLGIDYQNGNNNNNHK